MKKSLFIAVFAGALLCCFSALAEAADITSSVRMEASINKRFLYRLTDRQFNQAWSGSNGHGSLNLSSDILMYGLYIIWEEPPKASSIISSGKVVADFEDAVFLHQYYPLNGETSIRLTPKNDSGRHFGIKEIYVQGEGKLPSSVQRWAETYSEADMMLLFAHPDDEVLYFGGLLPYYGAERGLRVLPVLLTDAGSQRHTELLNCLWSLGIRHYPVFGPFRDAYLWDLKDGYAKFGKTLTTQFVVEQIRKHKPKVLVTHDIKREYGHGAHKMCADLAIRSLQYADDPEFHQESYQQFGGHRLQKLYLHLYRKNEIVMDWDQLLLAFGGKTGFELAREAYDLFHLSQHKYEQYHVEPRSSRYSSYHFGLYFSSVGPDIQRNDMMENIDIAGGQGL